MIRRSRRCGQAPSAISSEDQALVDAFRAMLAAVRDPQPWTPDQHLDIAVRVGPFIERAHPRPGDNHGTEMIAVALVHPDTPHAATHLHGHQLGYTGRGWLRCTVLHAGPVDAYRHDELTAITERVAKECQALTAFDLVFDRPTVGTVAVECAARPGAPYGTAGPDRPDRRALKVALSDHPGEPVALRADRLSLVAQSHDRHHITWTPIAEIPLAAH